MSTCADHVYGPDDYAARAEWGEEMVKTHVQSACDECQQYLIWTPKPVDSGQRIAPGEARANGSSRGETP